MWTRRATRGFALPKNVKPTGPERRVTTATELRVQDDGGSPTISGYAAVFNELSEPLFFGRERILPGAFRKLLRSDPDVRCLFNHNPDHILARTKSGTLALKEDKRGLFFEAELPDTALAHDIAASIARGDISGCSFSFMPGKERWSTENGQEVREQIEIASVFDVGPVTMPAYSQTSVSSRSLVDELELDVEALERCRSNEAVEGDVEQVLAAIRMLDSALPEERRYYWVGEMLDMLGRWDGAAFDQQFLKMMAEFEANCLPGYALVPAKTNRQDVRDYAEKAMAACSARIEQIRALQANETSQRSDDPPMSDEWAIQAARRGRNLSMKKISWGPKR